MRLTITIFLALFFDLSFGQSFQNDSILNSFIKSLIDSKVDTILIYEDGCVGCEDLIVLENDDSCYYYGFPKIYYIFWNLNGVGYVSKVSNYDCYEYESIPYNIHTIWNNYYKNKLLIKKEHILPPSYIDKQDTIFINVDHYSYTQITIIEEMETLDYEINSFYFSKMIDDKIININYDRNSRTFRKKLQIQIEKEIKNIEDNKLIKKRLTTACISYCWQRVCKAWCS